MAVSGTTTTNAEVSRWLWPGIVLALVVALCATAALSVIVRTLAADVRDDLIKHARTGERFGPLEYPEESDDYNRVNLAEYGDLADLAPSEVDVAIVMNLQTATIRTSWTGQPDHPMFKAALDARGDGEGLRNAMVGAFVSPTEDVPATDVDLRLENGDATIRTEQVVRLAPTANWDVNVYPSLPAGEANVRLGEVKLVRGDEGARFRIPRPEVPPEYPSPDRIADGEVVWDDALDREDTDFQRGVRVEVSRTVVADPAKRRTAGNALVHWAVERHPTWLRSLVLNLLAAVPFALAALWAMRHAANSRRFVSLLWVQALGGAVFVVWGLLERLNGPAAQSAQRGLTTGGIGNEHTSFFEEVRGPYSGLFTFDGLLAASLATQLVGWWVVARSARGAVPPRRATRRLVTLAAFALCSGVIGGLATRVDWRTSLALCAASLTVVATIAFVARQWAPGCAGAAGLGSAAIVTLVPFAPPFLERGGPLDTTVSAVFAAALALALLVAAATVASAVLTGSTARKWLADLGPRALPTLVVILAVVTMLFWPLRSGDVSPPTIYDVYSAGHELIGVLPFLLAVLLLWELRGFSEMSAADGWSFRTAWQLGAILLLAVVFEPTRTFWFVPLVALLGLAGFWIVADPKRPHVAQPFPAVSERLRSLDRLVQLRELDRVERRARVTRAEKLATGDLAANNAAAAATAIGEQRVALAGSNDPGIVEQLDFAVSAYGPGETAWHSGRIGALYSMLVGLPWIVLYWRQSLLDDSGSRFAIDAVAPMASVALTWIGYGFLFGYFYPHIIGRRAVTKAVFLAVMFAVPSVAFGAAVLIPLRVPDQTWGSLVALAVQVVAHFLVLAVLFDLHLVRRAGLPGGALLELRELRPVASWGGALVVALGGVITSVAVAGLTTIVSAGVSQFFPEPQEVAPPPATTSTTTTTTTATKAAGP